VTKKPSMTANEKERRKRFKLEPNWPKGREANEDAWGKPGDITQEPYPSPLDPRWKDVKGIEGRRRIDLTEKTPTRRRRS
jgi:hypothetical protein